MPPLDPTVRARLQACLDAAERPAVALGPRARIIAANRAASDVGQAPGATTFVELIAGHEAEIAGPCAEVEASTRALDLDIPSRARSVEGRERVRLVPFGDQVVLVLSRFGTFMAELDPVTLRSEIHEGLSQDLSALGFAACALRLRLDELQDPVLAELAARVEMLSETASTTVRALYRHFERGATGGLLDALAAMGAQLEEATATQLWIRVDGEPSGPSPHAREQVVALTRRGAAALATRSMRVWLRLTGDGDHCRIELRGETALDELDAAVRARLDADAQAIGATWTHHGATITLVV